MSGLKLRTDPVRWGEDATLPSVIRNLELISNIAADLRLFHKLKGPLNEWMEADAEYNARWPEIEELRLHEARKALRATIKEASE